MEIIAKFGLEFFMGIMGYLVRKWFGEELSKHLFKPFLRKVRSSVVWPIRAYIKRHLIKTSREAAIFLHYRNKAKNKGHDHVSPLVCTDDDCRII